MLTLIFGASKSGKSLLGETIAIHQQKGRLFYIATMHNTDDECTERIKRHQALRKDKDFITIEQAIGIDAIKPEKDATYLLECISNLVANEMYDEGGAKENTVTKILSDITNLSNKSSNVIIITNDVFSDITLQDRFCMDYLKIAGTINCELAKIADVVIESVATTPLYYKGKAYEYL